MKKQGLTLIEALVVLVIVAILTGILIPVMAKVKRNAQINESVSRLQQLWSAVELYRNEWDGSNTNFNSLAALGLPERSYWFSTWMGFDRKFVDSPCGYDEEHYYSAGYGVKGVYLYAPPMYNPGTKNHRYEKYLPTYRENAVLFADIYCNPPGANLLEAETMKRGLAVLLSGQSINKFSTGSLSLYFFSDPPE